jgi:hypothetical protein
MSDQIINKSSIFLRLNDFKSRHVKVTTSYKVFNGILLYIDSDGNISIQQDTGIAFIQRKYIVGIEVV